MQVSVHANAPGERAFADKQDSAKRRRFLLLVIDHFHAAVLLNPKLTNNDIVDTTGGVCPGVGFIISTETKKKKIKTKVNLKGTKADSQSSLALTWAAPV